MAFQQDECSAAGRLIRRVVNRTLQTWTFQRERAQISILRLRRYRPRSTLFLHGVCMLRECTGWLKKSKLLYCVNSLLFFEPPCIYGECAYEQHVRRTLTLTLTHTITAYLVNGNVRVRILICATRQTPCRKSSPVAAAVGLVTCLSPAGLLVHFRVALYQQLS